MLIYTAELSTNILAEGWTVKGNPEDAPRATNTLEELQNHFDKTVVLVLEQTLI